MYGQKKEGVSKLNCSQVSLIPLQDGIEWNYLFFISSGFWVLDSIFHFIFCQVWEVWCTSRQLNQSFLQLSNGSTLLCLATGFEVVFIVEAFNVSAGRLVYRCYNWKLVDRNKLSTAVHLKQETKFSCLSTRNKTAQIAGKLRGLKWNWLNQTDQIVCLRPSHDQKRNRDFLEPDSVS